MWPDYEPFSDDPFGDPLFSPYRRRPQRQAAFPPLPEAETDSLLAKIGRMGLSGLGWIGESLAKPSRALWGTVSGLSGNESGGGLLNLIPFSDTIGLTDPTKSQSASTVLERAGVIPQNKPGFDWWDVGRFGADVAGDPLSYAAPFGMTAKGLAAAKTAQGVTKGVGPAIHAGERAAVTGSWTPLGLLDKKLGLDPWAIGTGAKGEAMGAGFDKGIDWLGKSKAGLWAKSQFSSDAGMRSALGQEVEQFRNADYDRLMKPIDELIQQRRTEVMPLLSNLPPGVTELDVMTGLRQAAEGVPLSPKLQPLSNELNRIGLSLRDDVGKYYPEEAAASLNSKQLQDPWAEYFPRQKKDYDRLPGEGFIQSVKRNLGEVKATHASQISRKDFLEGFPGGTAQIEEFVGNPQYSTSLRTHTDLQVRDAIAAAKGVASNDPSVIGFERWLKSLPPGSDKVSFFKTDPVSDALTRGSRHAKAMSARNAYAYAVKKFASDDPSVGPRVMDVLENGGLVMGQRLPNGRISVPDPNLRKFLEDIDLLKPGQQLDQNVLDTFAGKYFPKEMADDFMKWSKLNTQPEAAGPLMQMYDGLLKTYKTLLYSVWPGSRIRDWYQGVFKMWLDDAADIPAAMQGHKYVLAGTPIDDPQLMQMFKAANPEDLTQKLVESAAQNKAAFTHVSQATEPQLARAGSNKFEHFIPPIQRDARGVGERAMDALRGLAPTSTQTGFKGFAEKARQYVDPTRLGENPLVHGMQKFGQSGDDAIRFSHYIAKLKQGFAPEAAAQSVRRYHFDYSKLTNAERQVWRRLFPWYGFMRNNLPFVVEEMIKKPGKLAASVRASTAGQQEGYVPQYVGEGVAVPLPGAPPGEQRFLSQLGLPFEDDTLGAAVELMRGEPTRALEKVAGQTMPLIKAPLELLAGKQFFSGRKLEDLKPTRVSTGFGLLSDESAGGLAQLVSNSPFSRFATTIDKVTDDRKGALEKTVNLLTGARVHDVDQEKALNIEGKRMLEDIMRQSPRLKEFNKFFVPEAQRAELTPAEKANMQLHASLVNRAKEASLEKRAAAGDVEALKELTKLRKKREAAR